MWFILGMIFPSFLAALCCLDGLLLLSASCSCSFLSRLLFSSRRSCSRCYSLSRLSRWALASLSSLSDMILCSSTSILCSSNVILCFSSSIMKLLCFSLFSSSCSLKKCCFSLSSSSHFHIICNICCIGSTFLLGIVTWRHVLQLTTWSPPVSSRVAFIMASTSTSSTSNRLLNDSVAVFFSFAFLLDNQQ